MIPANVLAPAAIGVHMLGWVVLFTVTSIRSKCAPTQMQIGTYYVTLAFWTLAVFSTAVFLAIGPGTVGGPIMESIFE